MSELWNKTQDLLRNRMDPGQFDYWIRPIRALGDQNGHLVLEVSDDFSRQWIQDNLLDLIRDALWDTARQPVGVEFRIAGGRPDDGPSTPAVAEEPVRLVSRFTFETYLEGPTNQVAAAACRMVADRPGKAYNPLFLWGPVGVGKTHLLHAIAHQVRAQHPDLRVGYMTGEAYVNEVMTAIKNNHLDQLRHRYRGRQDLLLLDDVQYLHRKEFPQDEFFHTFNSLYESGRQVVITSDQPPEALPDFSERLRSRFQWGLTVEIPQPDEDLRVRILLQKARAEGMDLPVEAARVLAGHFRDSVRELEGALNRMTAHSLIWKIPLSVELARRIVAESPDRHRTPVTAEFIVRMVAEAHGLSLQDLKGPKRHRGVSLPRQVAIYLIRKHTRASFPTIGEILGGRSHSTIVAGLQAIEKALPHDASLQGLVRDIEDRLHL